MTIELLSSPDRRLRIAAATSSLLIAGLGLAWCLGDALWYFDRDGERGEISALALVPQIVDAVLFLVLGALGVATALAGRGRTLVAVAAVQALGFAVLAGDVGVLMVLGYLIALAFPVVLVTTLLWGAARSRTAALALGALVVTVGAALAASGRIDATSLRELGNGLGSGVRTNLLPHLVVAAFVAHGLVWAVLGVRTHRSSIDACVSCGRRGAGEGAARWRVPVTLVAAACALPYGLLRLTWLTGSPWGMTDAELEAEPGIRVMGLLLGLAGLAGATLTIGLLRPWGRVFPRWLPRLGGRPVPVLFPTLTAGIVGAVMAVAGRSMVQQYVLDRLDGGSPEGLYLVLIPMPLWGPALMLAAWGYYLHARGTCSACQRGGSSPTGDAQSPASTLRTA